MSHKYQVDEKGQIVLNEAGILVLIRVEVEFVAYVKEVVVEFELASCQGRRGPHRGAGLDSDSGATSVVEVAEVVVESEDGLEDGRIWRETFEADKGKYYIGKWLWQTMVVRQARPLGSFGGPDEPQHLSSSFISRLTRPGLSSGIKPKLSTSRHSAEVLTHLKRELIHRVWDLLLSLEFIHAYVNGIVVECYDQVKRLIFPQFYSLPSRTLAAVPVHTASSQKLTCAAERTCGLMIACGEAPLNKFEVGFSDEGIGQSWVPTQNTFPVLAEHRFNLFSMFVPDLLHEVELGIVKAFFTHVIRILYTLGIEAVDELNSRFLHSAEAQYSASTETCRCLIPAVEGLLPEPHNSIVLTVCFTLATWHAYAKLQLHTCSSLDCFCNTTTVQMRRFNRTTCEAYETYELLSEYNRHIRRQAKKKAQSTSSASTQSHSGSKTQKYFNLSTYKWHSIDHYPDAIPRVGTTDSVSTQNSELAHRRVKQLYSRTNKRDVEPQIANHKHRTRILVSMNDCMNDAAAQANLASLDDIPNSKAREKIHPETEPLPRTPSHQHHHISESKRDFINVHEFLDERVIQRSRAHLLMCLLDLPYDGDEVEFSDQDLLDVNIVQHRIYAHQRSSLTRSTRELNPISWFCLMKIKTTHLPLILTGTHTSLEFFTQVFDMLERDLNPCGPNVWSSSGWKACRLHRVGFVDFDDGGAFGFLDPSEVIRAAHIIPVFHYGCTSDLLPPSIARRPEQSDSDFHFYYINCFVDRDMFMRYCEHAVGHRTTVFGASSPGNVADLDMYEEGAYSEDEGDALEAANESDLEGDGDEEEDDGEDLGPSDSEGEDQEDSEDKDVDNEDDGGDEEGSECGNDNNTASYGYDEL
ncbi:hypothetical protein R3P38DRAFT_3543752 [Favolaschia claudopus]|uniref:Uncharacterized protein n=1 Tax=Favolaschia claudopus TaxID=2862362 RepID=A0AAW0B623_9AGAR